MCGRLRKRWPRAAHRGRFYGLLSALTSRDRRTGAFPALLWVMMTRSSTPTTRERRVRREGAAARGTKAWWLVWTAPAVLRKQDERSKQHNPERSSAGGRPLSGMLHYFPASFRVLWHVAVTRTCHSCILRHS